MLTTILDLVTTLRRDTKGATAIEYGLIAALIAVIVIGAVTAVGTNLNDVFTTIANGLGNSTGGS